jgi:hypothetical protein
VLVTVLRVDPHLNDIPLMDIWDHLRGTSSSAAKASSS